MASIGCGEWVVAIVGRGGSPTRLEASFSDLSLTRNINTSGSASVSVPNTGTPGTLCCDVFENAEPWRDELILYRDNDLVYAGPLITVSASPSGGQLQSQDLFHWAEQRFIGDFHGDGDVADLFRAIFLNALEPDDSPNITINTRQTGINGTRDFKAVEFHRAADALRELARTGLDFTTIGRTVLAGGLEVFADTSALLLHDDGVMSAEVVREGSNLATDVAVFGAAPRAGMDPVGGRATTGTERYGLIQRSYTELLVKDRPSADANADARLQAMQPAPLRVKATLSQDAPFEFNDLLCGRRIDTRLGEAAGCIEVIDLLRLTQVGVSVSNADSGVKEDVGIDLLPIGVGET